jgi:MFS family permease
MLKRLLHPISFGFRSQLTNVILVVNAFVWYYATLVFFLEEIILKTAYTGIIQNSLIWGLHFGGLIIAAFVGTLISKKIEHRKLIMLWMILGVLSSLALLIINPLEIWQVSIVGLLLGASLGLGMPACMGHYADSMPVESRGRISGITLFVSGIGIAAFSIVGISDLLILGVVLAAWRLFGLVLFMIAKVPQSPIMAKKSPSKYKHIFSQHSFILYLIPWVMFSLINYLIAPSRPNIATVDAGNLALIQTGFMGLFALLGGFLIDSMGRKRIAVTGFILLGLGTAVLGISSSSLPILYFNAVIDGIAWGFLLVLFMLTVWGDLSYSESSDKYYALGVMPFFISKFLDLTVGSYIYANLNDSPALFSFGAFFLFLAVLPLIYAPETLPEKVTQKKSIDSYVEKAKKEAEKYY